MIDLRSEFELDATFGDMPGLSYVAGCLKKNDAGVYAEAQSEAVFQVWARGHKSCTVDVRDAFERMLKQGAPSTPFYAREWLKREGLLAGPPG